MSDGKCEKSVSDSGGWHSHPCGRPAKYGDYCGVHSPERRAERAKQRGPTQFERDCAASAKGRKRISDMEAELTRLRGIEEAARILISHISACYVDNCCHPNYEALRTALGTGEQNGGEGDG